MTLPTESHLQQLHFYCSTSYPCGYLPEMQAQSLIATPHHLVDTDTYSGLVELGFRRSGKFAYRPHCGQCTACIPVRLPVADFMPNRSQRRAWKQHSVLTAEILPLVFNPEHYALYSAYQQARHHESGEAQDDAEQYRNFLVQSNVDSRMVEFRENGVLKMVSVVDLLRDGVSAVYTFYDTEDRSASFGTYNVLWLATWCKTLKLPYLYLGYWIENSRKMAYKQNFIPQQGLINGEWQLLALPPRK